MKVTNRALTLLILICLTLTSLPVLAGEAGRSPVAFGIDVSKWQENIDFEAVAADGIDFVILRVGFWDTKDTRFDEYYDAAREAGLDVGAYIYSYSASPADARFEAKNVLSWIAGKRFEYPIFFDLEDDVQAPLTNAQRTALCIAFGEELEKGGYLAGVYANENWFNNYLERTELEDMPLWVAKWTASAKPDKDPGAPYGMWQYTDKGYVDGIVDKNGKPSTVDLDVCYTDYPAYIKENGLNGYEKEGEEPTGLPFTDVARDKWYFEGIKYAYDHSLVNGMSETSFAPDLAVTRGMFVTMLGRMAGEGEGYTHSSFLDVDMTRYYGPYIAWAHENGIVDGVGSDMFDPDGAITREQMAKIINGYLNYTGIKLPSVGGEPFTDDDDIAHWAKSSVYALSAAGVIQGVGGGAFAPDGNATRAQCATIIMRVHKMGG